VVWEKNSVRFTSGQTQVALSRLRGLIDLRAGKVFVVRGGYLQTMICYSKQQLLSGAMNNEGGLGSLKVEDEGGVKEHERE
jgi:hypothetical protein